MSPKGQNLSRRQFVHRVSAASAALAAPYFVPSGVLAGNGKPGPNDQIGIAGIGIGRRGVQVLDQVKLHADARIVAIADASLPRAEQNIKRYGGQLAVQDYHEILERSDIDAIVTANPAEIVEEPIRDDDIRLYQSDDHVRNWLDCIKSRKRCIADVEIGHRSSTVAHLANITRLLGRKLKWDPDQEIFPGDDEANTYLDRDRRKGYELPTVV